MRYTDADTAAAYDADARATCVYDIDADAYAYTADVLAPDEEEDDNEEIQG